MFDLHFHHANPGSLGGLIVRKWIVGKRPRMSLTPEPVHKRVDEFDLRIAVKFRGQLADEIGKRVLKKGIIVPRLIFRMRILEIPLRRPASD